jgi:hypothetical protein
VRAFLGQKHALARSFWTKYDQNYGLSYSEHWVYLVLETNQNLHFFKRQKTVKIQNKLFSTHFLFPNFLLRALVSTASQKEILSDWDRTDNETSVNSTSADAYGRILGLPSAVDGQHTCMVVIALFQ